MKFRFIVILGIVLLLAGSVWADWNKVTVEIPYGCYDLVITSGDGYLTLSIGRIEYRLHADGSIWVPAEKWERLYPRLDDTWKILKSTGEILVPTVPTEAFTLPYIPEDRTILAPADNTVK